MTGPVLDDAMLADPTLLEDALAGFIDAGAAGLALLTPARLSTTGPGKLQLVGCRVIPLREAALRPVFEDMALLVACHLESGKVYVARAFGESNEAADAPPPPPDPGEGWTGSSFRIDIRERLGLPRDPGKFALWLILRGESWGPVRFEITRPAPPPVDDVEVIKFIAEWRARNVPKPTGADPSSVWPRESVLGNYPSYRPAAESPPIPKQGISLWMKRCVVLEKGARWILGGSYRLAIPRRHVVLHPVSGDPATAVLPITLVITTSQTAGPMVLNLRVPGKTPINQDDATPVVEGYFTLNLFAQTGIWRLPQTYFAYAICGDTLSPPVVSSLVTESMLAGAE